MSEKSNKPNRMEAKRAKPRKRPLSEVLRSVKSALKHTELGLKDLKGTDSTRQASGLRSVIMNGRTVTFPMQSLWHEGELLDDAGHGQWYAEHVDRRFSESELARFFVVLRNFVEKEGILEIKRKLLAKGMHIQYLDVGRLMRTAPAGTNSITIGNDGLVRYHGHAGSETTRQVPGIKAIKVEALAFENTPPSLATKSVEELCTEYVKLLKETYNDAVKEFGESQ